MRPLPRWLAAPAALVLLAAGPAEAACTIRATAAVSFGAYDVFSPVPTDTTGELTFRCTPPRPAQVSIQLSAGSGGSFTPRRMFQGAEPLAYNLYLDATRTTIWGDGTGGTGVFTRPRPPLNQDIAVPVYGRVPAGQDVPAGPYADTVTATILF